MQKRRPDERDGAATLGCERCHPIESRPILKASLAARLRLEALRFVVREVRHG